jgi:hypothetical protein
MPEVILDPAPGTYVEEIDLTARANAAAISTGSMVSQFAKGDLFPRFWTNPQDFMDHYFVGGDPNPNYGFGGYSGLAFLQQSTSFWVLRVADGATYGGIDVTLDSSTNPTRVIFDPFPEGTSAGYEGGARNVQHLLFSAALVEGNSFSMGITNGETFAVFNPVVFSGSNNETMANIATELEAALDTLSPVNVDAVCEVIMPADNQGNSLLIKMYPATDTSIEFIDPVVTAAPIPGVVNEATAAGNNVLHFASVPVGLAVNYSALDTTNPDALGAGSVIEILGTGTVQLTENAEGGGVIIGDTIEFTPTTPDVTVDDNVELFTIFAENPGNWNDTIGIQITNINVGVQQRIQIRFAAPLISGNLVSLTVNGQAIESTVARLVFSGPMAAEQVFNAVVNDWVIAVPWSGTTSDDTLVDIAKAIEAQLAPGSICKVLQVPTSNGAQEVEIDISSGTVFTLVLDEAITGAGTPPTVTLTGPTTANGVLFIQDSDTTMQAIASALAGAQMATIVSAADVVVVPGSTDNDRDIVIVAEVAAPNELYFTNATVTGGDSQTIFTTSEILAGSLPTGAFTLSVFSQSNLNVPLEQYNVSLNQQTDGFGQQMNIETVINIAPDASKNIRIVQPTSSQSMALVPVFYNGAWTVTPTILMLQGGDDGNAVSSSDVINGWNAYFTNRTTMQIRILLNGGYSTPAVQQAMDSLAQSRMDCFCIHDMPSDSQSLDGTAEVTYRNFTLNLNSNYSAIYTPDVQILDSMGRVLYVPPSGYVGARYAYNDKVRAAWFDPAGLNRGLVPNILGLRFNYDHGVRSNFALAQINPIIQKPGYGYPVWDALTLQAQSSALSNVNVRRLLIVLEVAVTDALDFSLFDPNDSILQNQCIQIVRTICQPIYEGRGLLSYLPVCDSTNNSDLDEDIGQLNVDVYLQPTIPARKILFRPILTPTGASFQELIAAGTAG